jgi:hypothetical protein
MTFRLTAPHKDALHDKIDAYRLALSGIPGKLQVGAGMQNGQWVADLEFEE